MNFILICLGVWFECQWEFKCFIFWLLGKQVELISFFHGLGQTNPHEISLFLSMIFFGLFLVWFLWNYWRLQGLNLGPLLARRTSTLSPALDLIFWNDFVSCDSPGFCCHFKDFLYICHLISYAKKIMSSTKNFTVFHFNMWMPFPSMLSLHSKDASPNLRWSYGTRVHALFLALERVTVFLVIE